MGCFKAIAFFKWTLFTSNIESQNVESTCKVAITTAAKAQIQSALNLHIMSIYGDKIVFQIQTLNFKTRKTFAFSYI